MCICQFVVSCFVLQAEDGIRYLVRSRGLGDVYKRQVDRSLVIALPGKPQGAVDCLGFVTGAIPHSVKLALSLIHI